MAVEAKPTIEEVLRGKRLTSLDQTKHKYGHPQIKISFEDGHKLVLGFHPDSKQTSNSLVTPHGELNVEERTMPESGIAINFSLAFHLSLKEPDEED